MGLFEKNKLSDDGRRAYTQTVRALVGASLSAGDGRRWGDLEPEGQVRTGKELGRKPKDSAWWVGGGKKVKLNDDFGDFRSKLSDAAEHYGTPDHARAHERGGWGKAVQVASAVAGGVLMATGVAAGVGAAVIGGGQAVGRSIAGLGGDDADAGDVLGVLASGAKGAMGVEGGDQVPDQVGGRNVKVLTIDQPMAVAICRELAKLKRTGTLPDGEVRRVQAARSAGLRIVVTDAAKVVFAKYAAAVAARRS